MPTRRAMFSAVNASLLAAALLLFGVRAAAQEKVRVAPYDTGIPRTAVQGQRNLQTLRPVIELLAANVIGHQEIADGAAPNLDFPPADWFVAIDDNRMENAAKKARSSRERHLAEFEAIRSTMEEYGLLIRTRGDQGTPVTKPERIT